MSVKLSPSERARLHARSHCSLRTITRYLADPDSVTEASRRRLEDAARVEGILLNTQPDPGLSDVG